MVVVVVVAGGGGGRCLDLWLRPPAPPAAMALYAGRVVERVSDLGAL